VIGSLRVLTLMFAATSIGHSALAVRQQTATQGESAGSADSVCIAIVLPIVTGVEGDATAVAKSLQELFVSYLTGPSLRSLALDARLSSQATEEARQKQCPRVVTVTLIRKQRGGGSRLGSVIGQAAGTAAWNIPGSTVTRGATAAGAEAVRATSESTRAKDEIQLDYRVTSAEGGAVLLAPKSDKLKARANGEDLVTPLVAKAAEAILAAVAKK
jgi:hypothetical protein